jgi:hypothetical protein
MFYVLLLVVSNIYSLFIVQFIVYWSEVLQDCVY